MKKKIIGVGLLSLAIGFYACKKEALQNPSQAQGDVMTNMNKEKKIAGTFDPNSWNGQEVEDEVLDFVTDMENAQLANLTTDQAIWYVQAAINYENGNYKQFTESKTETYTYSVAVSNGLINGNDVTLLYNDLQTDINTMLSGLPTEFQNVLFIDVEANTAVSTGSMELSASVVVSHSNVQSVDLPEAAVTNFDHWYVGPSRISWYLPFVNGSLLNPACGSTYKAHGSRYFMHTRANGMISANNYGGITGGTGGSGANAWVTAPICNGNTGQITWIVDPSGYDLEGSTNFIANRDPLMAGTYPYEVMTRNSAGITSNFNLTNGCVGFPEIRYYADKSIHRAKSSAVYTWHNINTNKRVVKMEYKRTNYQGPGKVWHVPHATYGRCEIKSDPD